MSEWKPIETAPKDGTSIILWEKDLDTPFVGSWINNAWRVDKDHVCTAGEWWDNTIVVDDTNPEKITHWMTLPEPPEE